MRQNALRIVLFVVLLGGASGVLATGAAAECPSSVTVDDHSGTTVEVAAPAERVVVLEPAAAQIVWAIGAEDRVVGMPVGEYTSYLDGAVNKTDVTGSSIESVDVETIIAQQPDLVIAPNYVSNATIQQLRAAGITVYQRSEPTSINEIYTQTRLFGQFLGMCDAANQTVADMRRQVKTIETAVADRDSPRVLYYFFGYAAGEETFISELITTAGGENIVAEAGIDGFEPISKEVIAQSDPEWIVTPSHAGVPTNETPFTETTAVRSDQILVVDANRVSQPGPRVVTPLTRMAHAFHPNATLPPTDTAATASTPSTSGGPQPGFGIGVAAAVLVGAGLLTHRRRNA